MARMVQAEEHAARQNEILDAAQELVYRKGYAQMTIQDILEAIQISKGAFYHYFGSKQTLMEALVARMVAQMMAMLQPIADDPDLPALPKLEAIFRAAAGWKNARREFLVALLRAWYADENALVRDKLSRAALEQFNVLLQPVIAQGMAEGAMRTDYPELAGAIAIGLLQGMGLEVGQLLMNWGDYPDALARIERLVAAYTQAIERVLGTANGAVQLIDPALYPAWGETLTAR